MRIGVVLRAPATVSPALLGDRLRRWADGRGHVVSIAVGVADDLAAELDAELAAVDVVLLDVDGSAPGDVVTWVGDAVDRVVAVSLRRNRPEPDEISAAGIRRLHGRGLDTYRWAAQHAAARTVPAVHVSYGDDPDQRGELRWPDSPGPHPVVVLVHGGYWRSYWALDLMDDLAVALTDAGYATWNLEYRRGHGAASGALADVGAGIDHLRRIADGADPDLGVELDLDRVALVGHSAGGHLALWAAGRSAQGEPAALRPALCVGLAPVADLHGCAERGLGEDAAREFFGAAPWDDPERYLAADPSHRLPVGVPVAVVQGLLDAPDLVDLNRGYAGRSAAASTELQHIELPGVDHFHVIDPVTPAWARVEAVLAAHLLTDLHPRPPERT